MDGKLTLKSASEQKGWVSQKRCCSAMVATLDLAVMTGSAGSYQLVTDAPISSG